MSIFSKKFVDIFKKICRYFQKNLSIFSKKFVDIFKKICRYFQKKFVDIFVPTPVAEITDPRREKRKAFMEIPLQNPIEKLSEQKLRKDRERKQMKLSENREQWLATNNTEIISDNSSIKQLSQYVAGIIYPPLRVMGI